MQFTWDEKKKQANPKKHGGISFEQAQEIFEDPHHVILENYLITEQGEQRMQAIGMTRNLLLLLVIFVDRSTHSDVVIHLISARKATTYDQAIYQDQFR